MIEKTSGRVTLSIALLLAVQLLTSLGAIVLLGRMSPAIEKILTENVASSEAVEQMALALADTRNDPGARGRFLEALARARANITEDEEAIEIETLERVSAAALADDPGARREATAALRRLGDINRRAMRDADLAAQDLGTAGAWAAVLLGIVGMLASGITLRRLDKRVLRPIEEIAQVAAAHARGDHRRRAASAHATAELEVVMATLNELYDQSERQSLMPASNTSGEDRAIAIRLLDDQADPLVVVDERGSVRLANQRALDLLAGPSGDELRRALGGAPRGAAGAGVSDVRQLDDGGQWLCRLSPLPSGANSEYAPRP